MKPELAGAAAALEAKPVGSEAKKVESKDDVNSAGAVAALEAMPTGTEADKVESKEISTYVSAYVSEVAKSEEDAKSAEAAAAIEAKPTRADADKAVTKQLVSPATNGEDSKSEDNASASLPELEKEAERDQIDQDFLQLCLGGPAAVFEVELQRAAEIGVVHEEPVTEGSQLVHHRFSTSSDPECEEDDDNADLEDMFDFDPARLADLVNKGARVEELTEHLQDAYAEAFEQRFAMEAEQASRKDEDEEIGVSATGDLDQLMTPENVSPVETPPGAASQAPRKSLADCTDELEEKGRRNEERRRRSIAIQQRPSAAQRGHAAVRAMEAVGRRSLASVKVTAVEDRSLLEGAVEDAVRRASVRHRWSLTKAAEVLEEAADATDQPLEKWSDEKVDASVGLVQEAIDEARRRHLRSVADAVQKVVTGSKEVQPSSQIAESDCNVQARISQAVAAAYQRQRGGYTSNGSHGQWPVPCAPQPSSCWPVQEHGQQDQWSDCTGQQASAAADVSNGISSHSYGQWTVPGAPQHSSSWPTQESWSEQWQWCDQTSWLHPGSQWSQPTEVQHDWQGWYESPTWSANSKLENSQRPVAPWRFGSA